LKKFVVGLFGFLVLRFKWLATTSNMTMPYNGAWGGGFTGLVGSFPLPSLQ